MTNELLGAYPIKKGTAANRSIGEVNVVMGEISRAANSEEINFPQLRKWPSNYLLNVFRRSALNANRDRNRLYDRAASDWI